MSVDWRQRWGWNWITAPRDQRPCAACEAFGYVGLVESMARIEHGVWCVRSGGDLRGGLAPHCHGARDFFTIADFGEQSGIADPDCFPWQAIAAAAGVHNPPYHPTPDRSGRVTRGQDWTILIDRESQIDWLETRGPLL